MADRRHHSQPGEGGATATLETLRRAWGSLALVFLNTCLLLLVLNLALFAIFRYIDSRRGRADREARSPAALAEHGVVHPGLARDEIRALWEETYLASSGFVYEPFTQFKLKAFDGRYVSVDENGFRRHPGVGPWPPDGAGLEVFLFGGSTAFGYGVPDDQTIAAHLQRYLTWLQGSGEPVKVYNFGRSGYLSTQERLLFETQVTRGIVPDIAVFLDGLNDCRVADHQPIFTDRLKRLFEVRRGAVSKTLGRLPMMRLARAVTRRGNGGGERGGHASSVDEIARRMASSYRANQRMIQAAAASQGVHVLFVWQPVAVYNYDRSYQLVEPRESPHVSAGYQLMAEIAAEGSLGDDFLWLADMQLDLAEPLYVDQAHYSGPMCQRIATEIGDRLAAQGALRPADDGP